MILVLLYAYPTFLPLQLEFKGVYIYINSCGRVNNHFVKVINASHKLHLRLDYLRGKMKG